MTNQQIFVNLPVKNVSASITFFKHLGYEFNMQFTDENAACMVIQEPTNFVMLISEEFMLQFTSKQVANTKETCEVLMALSCISREEVDAQIAKVLEAGGNEHRPVQDHGWMYSRAFEDIDGHIWELAFIDPTAIPTA